jgi:hypothetical protein
MPTLLRLALSLAVLALSVPAASQSTDGAAAGTSSLVAKAWLDEDSISGETPVRLWVSFDNQSAFIVEGLTFDAFHTPGLIKDLCWSVSTPACIAGTSGPRPTLPSIAPGDRLVMWALVEGYPGRSSTAKVVLTGTYQWRFTPVPPRASSPGGKVAPAPSQLPIALRATVTTSAIELRPDTWFTSSWATAARDFGKDLLIPIAVLIGSLLFPLMLQRRTERQVIWTQMIGKVTKDAEVHFLQTSACAERLQRKIVVYRTERAGAADAAAADAVWHKHSKEILFELLLFLRRLQLIRSKIGGYYLQLESAEQVAAVAVAAFAECRDVRLGCKAQLERAAAQLQPSTTLGEFEAKAISPRPEDEEFVADVTHVLGRLRGWVEETTFDDQELLAVRLFYETLDIELNRPFHGWYGAAPHINRTLVWKRQAACVAAVGPIKTRMLAETKNDVLSPWFELLGERTKHYLRDTAMFGRIFWRPFYRLERRYREYREGG